MARFFRLKSPGFIVLLSNILGRSLILLASASLLAFAALPASADEHYYTDKTLRIIVPFKAGGGTDTWARFWAPLIARKIPGNPRVVVENHPGGGATKGTNLFSSQAGDDGLTILASSASVLYAYLLQDPRVRYDYRDWRALLASPANAVIYTGYNRKSLDPEDNDSLRDAASLPWRMHIQGPTQLGMIAMLSLELLGYEFEADFGAGGGADTLQSFRNGFYNIDMQTSFSYLTNVKQLVEMDEAAPLFTLGVIDVSGQIIRDSAFPEIQTMPEIYKRIHGELPKGRTYEVWKKFFLAGFPVQKMLIVPRDTNPEAIAILEEAIRETIEDEASWPGTKKAILGDYRQTTGVEADRLMREAIDLDPAALAWYKDYIKQKFNIEL